MRPRAPISANFSLLLAVVLLLAPAVAEAQRAQPGDRLVVRVFGGEQPFADTLLVAGNGTVVLPRLGPTLITGFDLPALPDSLRARYARYLRNPTVDVVVLRRVVVNGEVKKPDIYYVDLLATLPDVIAHAGGLTEAASPSKVSILRNGTTTRVPDWQHAPSSIGALHSGDQVIVGRRPWLQQNFVSVASTVAVLASIFITLSR